MSERRAWTAPLVPAGAQVRALPTPRRRSRRRLLRVLVGVLVGLLLFGAATGYVLTRPTTWASSAVVAFAPRPAANAPADVVALLARKYEAQISAPTTLQAAARSLGLGPDALRQATTVSVDTSTANLRITVALSQAATSAAAANALAQQVVQAAAGDQIVAAEVVAPAAAFAAQAKPPRKVLLAGAALLALLAGLLVGYAVPPARRPDVRSGDSG